MTEKDIRLECLKMACAVANDGTTAVEIAKAFEAFVTASEPTRISEHHQDSPAD